MRVFALLLLVSCNGKDDTGETDTDTDTDTDSDTLDARFQAVLDGMEADLAANQAGAVSVAIMEDGEVTFAAAVGTKNHDGEDPATPTTLFQIGSTTKQMTATTVLQKVEDGDLSLDDTLSETVPSLEFAIDSSWSDAITLGQQISMQSGLLDQVPWSLGNTEDSVLATFTNGSFANTEYQMNPAGEFFNYANPNFSLAGYAVELQDTRPWPDILHADVFAPLGMDRSWVRKAPVVEDDDYAEGIGYRLPNYTIGTVGIANVCDHAWVRPPGLVWSSPTQMMTWAKFLIDGDTTVLSDALRAEITTPHRSLDYGPEGADGSYGYGMFVSPGVWLGEDYYPMEVWDHGGNTLSYTSALYILPDQDAGISVLISGYGASAANTLLAAFENVFELPAAADPAPVYAWEPDRLDDHVGEYYDPYNVGDMIVTRVGDALQIEMPFLEGLGFDVTPELLAVSDTVFYGYVDGQAYDLTFIGEPGTPSEYIRNRSFVLTRVPGQAVMAPVTPRDDLPAVLRLNRAGPDCPVSTRLRCP